LVTCRPSGRRAALVLAGLLLTACSQRPSPPRPRPELRIEEYQVIYRGFRLTLGTSLDEWRQALGEPSRYVDRDGGIFVWDDLGMAVSLRPIFVLKYPHVSALRIFFAPRDVDFWPRTVFRGSVELVQQPEDPNHPPVVALLDATSTSFDLSAHQKLSTHYGFPHLTNYTTARFAGERGLEGPLELLSVEILGRGTVQLPSEPPPSPLKPDEQSGSQRP
jgi:hypothetical protein